MWCFATFGPMPWTFHKGFLGRKHTVETRLKMSAATKGKKYPKKAVAKLGIKNPMWKGDDVSRGKLHMWVRRHKPDPGICQNCGRKARLDCANISGEYKRDLADWCYICRSCHTKSDNRVLNFETGGV